MYHFGKGVPQHYVAAAMWYRKAADQGYARAQYNLGSMYHKGQGVAQDYAAAVRWYRKAAEQGHTDAQTNLGVMYHEGQGVTRNFVQAHLWLNLAAAKGQKLAREARDLLIEDMTPAQIAEAQKLAREWKPQKGSE